MNIVHAGIFKDHELGGDIIFKQGFIQNKCTVHSFDYRTLSSEYSVEQVFSMLRDVITSNTDILFIGKGEIFNSKVLHDIKKKGVTIVLWYGDLHPEPESWLLNILPEIDYFFMSSGGYKLKEYFNKGKPKVASYYFNPSDPSLIEKYQIHPRCTRDILFTGSHYKFIGNERKKTIKYLKKRNDVTFFGGGECNDNSIIAKFKKRIFGGSNSNNWIRGEEYIAAIKSANIGIGVSAFQDIPRYTSDRLTHYLTFGTFYLTWEFPQISSLFDVGKEIITFHDTDDLDYKINYYLKNVDERETIARAAQRKVLLDYNCKNIVGMMLDIINTGNSTRFPWVEIYK
jgi:hypothetical protein